MQFGEFSVNFGKDSTGINMSADAGKYVSMQDHAD
jgi:hypothetical protein